MGTLYKFRHAIHKKLLSAQSRLTGNTQYSDFQNAMANIPLVLAEKTYNTAHPDYDPSLVDNYPGVIFDGNLPCTNPLFLAIKELAKNNKVPQKAWDSVLKQAMLEASTVPGFEQVMERTAYIENYMAELGRTYDAHYVAGWVNMFDAQFLYWAVRQFKPKVIVQTGVSNGLSSAFMMLALAKNGPEGKLYTIDIPAIFDDTDPAWTQKGTVYGVVIPKGKSSGWIVPDIYKDRFEVMVGDARGLMPRLVDKLDSIDMFYHDSDHSYHHMMFEFAEAMRKLSPDGVVMADDISWNASLWDFAKQHKVPAYNFSGTVGTAFFSKNNAVA